MILRLAKVFVILAFVNFLAGATLGGIMAGLPNLTPFLVYIHAELNPYGWLTLLIYGMTYVVLVLSLGIRLPFAWQGWAHCVFAETGVVLLISATLMQSPLLYHLGMAAQTLSPILFLINILSSIFYTRRLAARRSDGGEAPAALLQQIAPSLFMQAGLKVFGRRDDAKQTDKIAQRGTDVSLMVFVAAAVWALIRSFQDPMAWVSSPTDTAALLVYFGWIAGTVLSVALHLYPRFADGALIPAWLAQTVQMLWAGALLIWVVSIEIPSVAWIAAKLMGLCLTLAACGYLLTLRRAVAATNEVRIQGPSVPAWWIAWSFALILGLALLIGLLPASIAALHLLFLGWITTLVYGVGYIMFPFILGKQLHHRGWSYGQVAVSAAGACLMPIGFQYASSADGTTGIVLVAVGGILASVGAIMFIAQWLFARPAV